MPNEFKPIKFPEDELAHNHIIEWWYFNGHLKDKKGNEYAFMNCLFKADVKKVKIPFLNKIFCIKRINILVIVIKMIDIKRPAKIIKRESNNSRLINIIITINIKPVEHA